MTLLLALLATALGVVPSPPVLRPRRHERKELHKECSADAQQELLPPTYADATNSAKSSLHGSRAAVFMEAREAVSLTPGSLSRDEQALIDRAVDILIESKVHLSKGERRGPIFIGVCGCSGSGKSTFAANLKELMEDVGIRARVIGQDSYYKTESDLTPQGQQPEPSYERRNRSPLLRGLLVSAK